MATGRMRAVVASLLLASLLATAMGREERHSMHSMLKSEKIHESKGGRLDMWRSDQHESLKNARMEGARCQLKERGLLLPKYADSGLLFYCSRGSAIMGMSLPMGARRDYRMIRKGQVVAVPRGMVFWFYNTGEKECTRRNHNGREEEREKERERERERKCREEERERQEREREREEEERERKRDADAGLPEEEREERSRSREREREREEERERHRREERHEREHEDRGREESERERERKRREEEREREKEEGERHRDGGRSEEESKPERRRREEREEREERERERERQRRRERAEEQREREREHRDGGRSEEEREQQHRRREEEREQREWERARERERERREEEGERRHRRERERDREEELGGECHLVAIADTSVAAVNPGQCSGFSLVGHKSEEWGSMLQGFSKELLAEAWDVDEQTVEKLVTSQKETGIMRVEEDHPFHQLMRERQCGRGSSGEVSMQSMSMMHFMYDLDSANCDHYSGGGGCMTVLNRYRLPVLNTLRPDTGLGAIKTELEPEAMMAPGYMANAHTLLYCSKGSVRVQVLSPTGERSFDEEIKEGHMMMIPMGHPVIKRAGREGCHLMAFTTSDTPMKMHVAGDDSVLRNMPQELLMAAFNVDEKFVSELMQRHIRYAAILPPSRQQREQRREDGDRSHGGFLLNIDKFFKNLLKN